jgi:2-methylcitrate dehydratase
VLEDKNMNLAEMLSDFFLSVNYSKLDENTIEEAKKRIVDSFGCAIGASKEKPILMATNVSKLYSSKKDSTVLCHNIRTSPDIATFVNGFMVRYFDYNDTYLSKEPAHPSDNLSTCLSIAESEGRNGKDIILALVLSYEIQCRLCDAADIRHRGWDHVNYGLVSTSLAASKLMGLKREEATNAVNIALNGHIAMRQVRAGELSMWKGASFANAARNGVFSAILAREGITGPSPIFEGEMGFFKQVSGEFSLDLSSFGGRGGRYKIGETYIKYWPAEYHSQSAIWASIRLREKVKSLEEIKNVIIETHEAGYTILGKDREKWRPKTKETADHSLPFIVATALIFGKVDNSSYSKKRLEDEKILGLVDKIKVLEDKKLTELYPSKGIANRVTVEMKDGTKFTEEVIVPKGHPLNPMSREEIELKFRRLTARYYSQRRMERLLERLWNIDKISDVAELISEFKF